METKSFDLILVPSSDRSCHDIVLIKSMRAERECNITTRPYRLKYNTCSTIQYELLNDHESSTCTNKKHNQVDVQKSRVCSETTS
jgi:hypothetical protein